MSGGGGACDASGEAVESRWFSCLVLIIQVFMPRTLPPPPGARPWPQHIVSPGLDNMHAHHVAQCTVSRATQPYKQCSRSSPTQQRLQHCRTASRFMRHRRTPNKRKQPVTTIVLYGYSAQKHNAFECSERHPVRRQPQGDNECVHTLQHMSLSTRHRLNN